MSAAPATKKAKQSYEVVIGLEIHAQIATKSKMFCQCSSDAFNADPNENVCPICMGFPGQLPVINEQAVRLGLTAALALNCGVPAFSKFDRKNYFYPDLPKGYQISQYDQPLAEHGWLDIDVGGELGEGSERKKVRILRLHLEDDAGKLTHVANGTLCDYNRSGIGLMEIVSEPDMRSAAEAGAYARAVQSLVRSVGASDADMEKGMMRFDASVSLRPAGDEKLYPRAEIKNLNSFKSLEAAIRYEIERQSALWDDGNVPLKETTVGWSDDKGKTYFLRDKEGAADYRYFPEPDLPPLTVGEKFLEEIRASLPELPAAKKTRYMEQFGMGEAEAVYVSSDADLARFFDEVVQLSGDAKRSALFVSSVLLGHLNKKGIAVGDSKVTAQALADLIGLVEKGSISLSVAKGEVFEELFENGGDPGAIVKARGLEQVSDSGAIEAACSEVLAEHASVVLDLKGGKGNAMGFLVGQVMKKTKGQANPQMVNDVLKKLLG